MARGLVLLFTGEGKGKTTAALGTALRAWGHGMRILFLQFVKGERVMTGERLAASRLGGGFILETMGAGFIFGREKEERHREAARRAWERAKEAVSSGEYDLVVLDEFTYVLRYGFVSMAEVEEMVRSRPAGVHLIFTGRGAPQELIDLADTVTEMREVKHHYRQGISAQKGIEY
ncbi:cob(I)yrinic acid a,c-diamide adenosyltransferase [Ammonifex thiophilus]|uniref:Cob(I)yrinic acid a,c-diamide adenosyltransferase n=1 Tax=Ammonifex thiophilus TaxID=444093 RepID=A0A3D8P6X7_9THEO|nr:cob(I)yrinic acid a,c-diamide adenosyltransferase [Ammonifex thiophilus]RDV84612.1 cob(I)yrinic acid a,c-diamide adenosyltransferase [Ammonifex thiophilus]